MNEVIDEYSAIFQIKKSKFIAYLSPYKKFDSLMSRLRKEHPKAKHFVYAYQFLNEHNQIIQNSSDDKEPRGTSGKPSLKVLNGANIINSCVIIVRYFGGIKLGTGGLVKAYTESVNMVISCAKFKQYEDLKTKILNFNYKDFSKIEYLIKLHNINIVNKQFRNDVSLILMATKEKFDILKQYLPKKIELKDE